MTDTRKRFPLLILSAVLFFLIICPLVTIFVRAVITDGRLDFGSAWQTLTESKNAEMILNSLLLGAAVTAFWTWKHTPHAKGGSWLGILLFAGVAVCFGIFSLFPPTVGIFGNH